MKLDTVTYTCKDGTYLETEVPRDINPMSFIKNDFNDEARIKAVFQALNTPNFRQSYVELQQNNMLSQENLAFTIDALINKQNKMQDNEFQKTIKRSDSTQLFMTDTNDKPRRPRLLTEYDIEVPDDLKDPNSGPAL
ncbi:hypothetical protein [Facilibium subflavum]|uniref:hypothetical protein n=1 Tax=Facilibium subflavum TaxID=2219058 RepID=UPI000E64BA5B|nr:hypothetical protein [Facilibium subflavum]